MINKVQQDTAAFAFTDADFDVIAQYAAREYGLDLKIEKKGLIYARLARRIRALGMQDFKSYCSYATAIQNTSEKLELLSALTTNVTSFFREQHHFDMLKDDVLPPLAQRLGTGRKLRIWSAGCSGGQEPFSIAATIKQVLPSLPSDDVQILATDVDERILEKAQQATYRHAEVSTLSPSMFAGIFGNARPDQSSFEVKPDIRRMVRFGALNLVGNWIHDEPFDIIFCRNVVIYFERATQHQLWQRFHDCLTPRGRLFIGHSERLSGHAEALFRSTGITAFEKIS